MYKSASLFVAVVFLAPCLVAAQTDATHRSTASEESATIFELFLDQWLGKAGHVNLSYVTEFPDDDALHGYAECLKGEKLAIPSKPQIEELRGTALEKRKDVGLVEPTTWRVHDPGESISKGVAVSKAVDEGMKGGLLSLSTLIFDEQHKVAVLSYSFVCGSLCGSGGTVIFDKKPSGWKARKERCGGWVS